jgi:hypothetical protein
MMEILVCVRKLILQRKKKEGRKWTFFSVYRVVYRPVYWQIMWDWAKRVVVVVLLLHTNINSILGIGRADGKEKIKKILSADIFIRCPVCVCVCVHTIHLLDPCENRPVDTQQCFAPRRCSRVYSLEAAPTFSFLVQLHIRIYNIHYTLYIHRPADYMCGVSIQQLYRMKNRNAFIPFSLFTERHSRGSLWRI